MTSLSSRSARSQNTLGRQRARRRGWPSGQSETETLMHVKPFHRPVLYGRTLRPRKTRWTLPLSPCAIPVEGSGTRYLGKCKERDAREQGAVRTLVSGARSMQPPSDGGPALAQSGAIVTGLGNVPSWNLGPRAHHTWITHLLCHTWSCCGPKREK